RGLLEEAVPQLGSELRSRCDCAGGPQPSDEFDSGRKLGIIAQLRRVTGPVIDGVRE
ncbi:MAG: hypothetical protein QOG10_2452, partial [Kribbellaceae bacterium]|nr:hypothetical protein [Kribbellaceae bacterium]